VNTKQEVRVFYDQVGWSQAGEGLYQNARYEDLRPVVHDYIHRCHLRVNRYLDPAGNLFLDAGSGPVQYPEYLTYSEGYRYRVCADISITALKEARQRLGDKGLYVVMDIANLPFKVDAFDGVISLHTIHHLPAADHRKAYAELYRVLGPGRRAVVVNGWSDPPLMRPFHALAQFVSRMINRLRRADRARGGVPLRGTFPAAGDDGKQVQGPTSSAPTGTFVHKSNAKWLRGQLQGVVPFQIFVWRSVSTKFTRTYIHAKLAGRLKLRFIYWLEERLPRFLGENGQYPLVSIQKQV
jgi:SAM-dependent methyltransferase